jgi:hypothetical protein
MARLVVEWLDGGREPQQEPDPRFPKGIDLDISQGKRSCTAALPYPAKRCGWYVVKCETCDQCIILTTAGRPDDPRSIKVPCHAH